MKRDYRGQLKGLKKRLSNKQLKKRLSRITKRREKNG